MMDLSELVDSFSSTPFLFVGSGLSRRYLGLPDWQSLLKVFASRIHSDEFAFESYLDSARSALLPGQQELAVVAKLMESDFNQRWYKDPEFRQLNERHLEFIKANQSPFKVELACYLLSISEAKRDFREEIELLSSLTRKSISGIITTNYDNLMAQVAGDYTVYVGQEELLFSPIQGLAEVYMIHGSVMDPSSIVITQDDYALFEKKSAYLASKLMTIFMEYPIIFIGYSLTDANVRTILKAIVRGLTEKHLEKLQNRLVYVEWVPGLQQVEVSHSSMVIDDSTIRMTSIRTDNFSLLYHALARKRTALPVKVLRMFKDEFYQFTLTNQPVGRMRVAGIEDSRVNDDDLVLAIATPERLGLRGLSGLTAEEWYRHIVLDDLHFTADELLQNAYPQLIRQNQLLPLHKILKEASQSYPEIEAKAISSFDAALTNTIRRNKRSRIIPSRTINGILEKSPTLKRALVDMSYLNEDEFDLQQLERFLVEKFTEKGFYSSMKESSMPSDFRRLVRIYDWLKYGKQHQKKKPRI